MDTKFLPEFGEINNVIFVAIYFKSRYTPSIKNGDWLRDKERVCVCVRETEQHLHRYKNGRYEHCSFFVLLLWFCLYKLYIIYIIV